jgi:sensor histidine kinase YesM
MTTNYIDTQKKGLYLAFQLVGWGVYAILLVIAMYLQGSINHQRTLMIICSATIGLMVTHLIRLVYLKVKIFQKKITQLIPQAVLIVFLGCLVFELIYISIVLLIDVNIEPISFLSILGDIISLFFVLLIWSIIYFANHFIRKSRIEEIKNLQLTAANNEIELNHLRSQLNPHFLFNAMNSIRALIHSDPDLAKVSITQLSNILRNSLIFGKNKFVSVEEECSFVKDYLSLEKIRFEERLNVNWLVDDKAINFPIPPLIIQTLVENSIKHGISNSVKGGVINIKIQLINGVLLISVANTGTLKKSNNGTGLGLNNTARRLHILYGGKASFQIEEKNKEVVSLIKIEQI